jgi:mannitol-1-phosphate 5-dehydrogenase
VALTGTRTFTGFGFGAIQAGLFLHEAYFSGRFHRLVVAEIQPDVVSAVMNDAGRYAVNVAHRDRIETVSIGPVEVLNPGDEADRRRLIEAVAASEEMATALPSVDHYVSTDPGSPHRVLAEGMRAKAATSGPRAVLYAAENHNRAAGILQEAVRAEIPRIEQSAASARIRYLNTVIGKMSGSVAGAGELRQRGLTPIALGFGRAFLVEAFNRILISRVRFGDITGFSPFVRGIEVFREKDDLLPFEEAKLYGHNATHALAAYVGAIRGVRTLANLADYCEIMSFLRAAFIEESGQALIRRHAGVDPLFTPEGYGEYAEDLLARMVNPFLHDTIDRVGRDPARKLAWDDRLVGTIRMALQASVNPARYAFGAAAALVTLDRSTLDDARQASECLDRIWEPAKPDADERTAVLELIERGRQRLRSWIASGFVTL